jgi:hypothetical protein
MSRMTTLARALMHGKPSQDVDPYLARMKLLQPRDLRERIYQRLVALAVRESRERA